MMDTKSIEKEVKTLTDAELDQAWIELQFLLKNYAEEIAKLGFCDQCCHPNNRGRCSCKGSDLTIVKMAKILSHRLWVYETERKMRMTSGDPHAN